MLVDAGPLFVAATTADSHHERPTEQLADAYQALVAPPLPLTDVAKS